MSESQIDENSDLGAENPPGDGPTPAAQSIENVEGDAVVEAPGNDSEAPADADSDADSDGDEE